MLVSNFTIPKERTKTNFPIRILFSFVFIAVFVVGYAQTNGDFRSKKNGEWKSKETWQEYKNGSWKNAKKAPKNDPYSTVTIRNGHVVEYDENNAQIANLIIEQGAHFYRNSSSDENSLILYGDITCNGIIGSGNTIDKLTFEINGESTTISGTGECSLYKLFKNDNSYSESQLIIDTRVLLTTAQGPAIYNAKNNTNLNIVVNPGAVLTTQAVIDLKYGNSNSGKTCSLELKSDETGYGSLIAPQVEDSDAGNTLVERFLSEDKWHYIAAPVDDPSANVFYDIYMMEFDEPSGQWNYITDPNQVLDTDMKGYAVWTSSSLIGNTTLQFTGPVNSGYQEIDLTYTASANHINRGFNFVGNPYCSAIDWDYNGTDGWVKENVDNAVYQWNGELGGYGSYVNGYSVNQATNIIPAHQGFYVHCNQPTGKIGVDNGVRLHDQKPFFKSENNLEENVLRLTVSGNSYTDETLIHFDGETSYDFEPAYDAIKMMGLEEAPQVFSITGNNDHLSINSQPEATSVAVGVQCSQSGIYSISWKGINSFKMGQTILLEDLKTGQIINMNDQAGYTFSYDPAEDLHRFNVLFSGPNAITEDQLQRINVFGSGKSIMVVNDQLEQAVVSVYNLTGQLITQEQIVKGQTEIMLGRKGYFIIRTTSGRYGQTNKVVLR